MPDPSMTPETARELLAVFPDRPTADRVRRAVIAAGVPEADVRIDAQPDTVASLRAEMREEMTEAWAVPNAGVVYPKESARGLALGSVIAVAVGLGAAFPLALIDFGSTYPVRLLIFALIGVTFGLTVALVAGPASSAKRPSEPSAAQRGSLVRVRRDTEELRELLTSFKPIRLDEVTHDGDPVGTVATEASDVATEAADPNSDGKIRDAAAATADTAREMQANAGGDDYHRQR